MCVSTRFPEAIPLRNIKTKTIVQTDKALVKFFTFVGLPKSAQSDQGSNFMSGVFQQVMHKLGIKQYRSSAYHPESHGALESFHQTLKNIIRPYCFDTDKDWDEGTPFTFCCYRICTGLSRFRPFRTSIWPHCSWTFKTFKREISLTRRHSLELTIIRI